MNSFQRNTTLLFILLLSITQACKSTKDLSSTTSTLPKPVGVDPAVLAASSLGYADANTTILSPEVNPISEIAIATLDPNTLMASLERTKCYGKCPNYEAKVFTNGLVLFEGKTHVTRKGLFEAYLLQAQIDSLMSQAEQLSYFDMAENYPESGFVIAELPSTITYLKQGEREQKITNNHNAPKMLQSYERYFEELLDTLDWKPVMEH